MIAPLFPTSQASEWVESPARSLFVPVDASSASRRAVNLAIGIARDTGARIVLVDVLPDESVDAEPDPELVRALFMAAELGLGAAPILPPEDEQTRACRRVEQVLMPLRRLVHAAGVPVRTLLLRGRNPEAQLRFLVQTAAESHALVLSNPGALFSGVKELTGDLLLDPPCRLYVDGLDRPRSPGSTSLFRRAVTSLLHPATIRARN
jgi:nucleotide-binding universal stress UspA family protein